MKTVRFDKHILGPFCFYLNGDISPNRKSVLILPPGAMGAEEVLDIIEKMLLINDFNVIVPDLPGRGDSRSIRENSFSSIAKGMHFLINSLPIDKVHLIGISFGSAVVNEMVRMKSDKVSGITLVAGGEFFGPLTQLFLRALFWLPGRSKRVRDMFKDIIVNKFNFFGELIHHDAMSILAQWNSALTYRIREDIKSILPAKHVILKHDFIITRRSKRKLRSLYPNLEEVHVDASHISSPDDSSQLFDGIIDTVLRDLKGAS